MDSDAYAEKLEWFKQNEKPEAVLFIGDDPDMIKVVVAWPNMIVTRAEALTSLEGNSESEVWDWLWSNTVYSREELIAKSGLNPYALDGKLAPLIGNRVLYPDGTVNSFVERYLRERVLKLFDAKPKRVMKKR